MTTLTCGHCGASFTHHHDCPVGASRGAYASDDMPWKKVAENLSKELTMERNWRMRLQEEVWALDPSKDPRRDGHGPEDYPHEHVYRCQDCGEIDGSGVTGGGSEKAPPPGQGALQPPAHIDGEAGA